MKVLKIISTDSETASEIDLFSGLDVTDDLKASISESVGDYLLETIGKSLAKETSPIDGSKFKPLSPTYRKRKKLEVNSTQADLELYGIMKDELTYEATDDGIRLGIYGERAPAADNHNKFSGESRKTAVPRRQFLPREGEGFTSEIEATIENIIQDAMTEALGIPKNAFNDVQDAKGLYSVLKIYFPDLSRPEIKSTVVRSERLYGILSDEDLTQYL